MNDIPSLDELMKEFPRSERKNAASSVLSRDYRTCRTEYDFREMMNGMIALEQLVGHKHKAYRDQIAGMKRTLEIYHKMNRWLLPDAAVKEVERGWREMCELFKAHLGPEIWEKAEELTVRVFKDVRKLLEDAKP